MAAEAPERPARRRGLWRLPDQKRKPHFHRIGGMTQGEKRTREGEAVSASGKIQLRCLGFCGADDSVEPSLLAAISAQYPWVEWGVLFRPDKAGMPRYASRAWLDRLASANAKRTMLLAGHLCSTRVDEVLSGDTNFVAWLHEAIGFRRVQINATKANGSNVDAFGTDAGADACAAALRNACAALPQVEFIVQRNSETRPLWERLLENMPENMSVLFDDSMGLGVSTTSWPAPPPMASPIKFGYAGGLSPTNLKQQLGLIETTAPVRDEPPPACACTCTCFVNMPWHPPLHAPPFSI